MKMSRRHHNSGLTLIEVMISMIVIMLILIGAVQYMYGSMWNAKRADVRITATRIGQILLETWKITGHNLYNDDGNVIGWEWSVNDFNPTTLTLPVTFTSPEGGFDLTGDGIVGTELGDYITTLDGVAYFITLLFDDNQPRMLNARVGWNLSYGSSYLDEENFQYVDITSYAIY